MKKAIKTINMNQLAEYRRQLRQNPRLTYLFIELTDQCNMRCLHCGSSCDTANRIYIDTGLILKCLGEIARDFEPQTVMVCLTGGEPLLHPDFFRIVEEIVDLGFPWGMTTNATLINAKTASRLKALGLSSVTISIDGLEESHEQLRNCKGCFGRTIEAIDHLKREQIPVQVTTVIHKKNFQELEPLYKLMCNLEVCSWRVINMEPIGRALQNRDLLLDRSEFWQMLEFIREKRFAADTPIDVRFGCSHYLSFEYEHEVRDNYFLCGSGIYVGSILCNGDIYSCLDIERRKDLVQGNIAVDRFSDIWFNRFEVFRTERSNECAECRECEERIFCSGDSTHTWDFDEKRPRVCVLRKENLYGKDV